MVPLRSATNSSTILEAAIATAVFVGGNVSGAFSATTTVRHSAEGKCEIGWRNSRRGRPEALHPRVATVAVVLLRNEYVTRGCPTAPDHVLIEIVDEVYVPLVRGR